MKLLKIVQCSWTQCSSYQKPRQSIRITDGMGSAHISVVAMCLSTDYTLNFDCLEEPFLCQQCLILKIYIFWKRLRMRTSNYHNWWSSGFNRRTKGLPAINTISALPIQRNILIDIGKDAFHPAHEVPHSFGKMSDGVLSVNEHSSFSVFFNTCPAKNWNGVQYRSKFEF